MRRGMANHRSRSSRSARGVSVEHRDLYGIELWAESDLQKVYWTLDRPVLILGWIEDIGQTSGMSHDRFLLLKKERRTFWIFWTFALPSVARVCEALHLF